MAIQLKKYMMKVDGCCCCCQLRTGTLVLLWVTLVTSVLEFFQYVGALSRIHSVSGGGASMAFVDFTICYFLVHLVILTIIPCGLGLYGVATKRPSYLKPYIYVGVFNLIMVLIVGVVFLLMATVYSSTLEAAIEKMSKDSKEAKDQRTALAFIVFTTILILALAALLQWYLLSVVYRYHEKLSEELKPYPGGNYNAPPQYDASFKT